MSLDAPPPAHVSALLAHFEGVERLAPRSWIALCPGHNDHRPSLAIDLGADDRILLTCRSRGCSVEAIVAAVGTTMAALFAPRNGCSAPTLADDDPRLPICVAALAATKKVPVDFLRALGLRDQKHTVVIPYYDMTGQLIGEKMRTSRIAKEGSRWPKGRPLMAYGLWRLTDAREAGYLLIVEGESDCWAAWVANIPALGLPGSTTARTLQAEFLVGIKQLWVLQERDGGGPTFVTGVGKRLRELAFAGQAYRLQMPDGLKDLADLYADDPERFVARWQAACEAAAPLDFAVPPREGAPLDRDSSTVAAHRVRPEFEVSENFDLYLFGKDLWQLVSETNRPPYLFRFGDGLARIERDPMGHPFAQRLDHWRLRGVLAERIEFYRKGEKGPVPTTPPRIIGDLLVWPDPPVPILSRVVSTPILTPDGEIHSDAGYDARSRSWYEPADGFTLAPVPATPTPHEVRAACLTLLEPFADFPFVSKADKANTLAALLTIFLRDLIDGPTPLFLFKKPTGGTGATLCAETIVHLATGRTPITAGQGEDDAEWKKKLTAILLRAPDVVFFDNLGGQLESDALCRALTGRVWDERLLGHSQTVHLPIACTWIATANNLSVGKQEARRICPIQMDAKSERPWLRTRDGKVVFTHPDLPAWVRAERPRLVHAALTLCRAWIAAGRPRVAGPAWFGMFERWMEVLGGVLEVAGLPGFLTNLDALYDEADIETDLAKPFLSHWWLAFGEEAVDATTLYDRLLGGLDPPVELPIEGRDKGGRVRSFGWYLRGLRGQTFDLGPMPAGPGEGAKPLRVVVQRSKGSHRPKWFLSGTRGEATA